MGFALHYIAALGVVALVLLALQAIARLYARRAPKSQPGKIAEVLESTPLTAQAALHVVSIEGRRYLVGSSGNAVALLAILPRDG